MKNELKLNIIELIKEIEDLHEACRLKLKEELKGMNIEAVNVIRHDFMGTLFDEATPLINELEDLIQAALIGAKTKQDKEELERCIDFTKIFSKGSDEGYMGEFKWRVNDVKSYLEGLVKINEQLHGTATGQSPASKPGKEPGDQ